MAKLPDVTAFGEQPVPAAVGARTSYQYQTSAEFAQGDAMQKLGATFTHIDKEIERQQDHFSKLRAEDAYNKLVEARLDLTSGENGFTKVKGRDAVERDLQKEYGQQFTDSHRRILGGLKGPKDKEYFNQRASVAGLQFRQDLLNHVTQQADVYAQDVFKSGVSLESQNAMSAYRDPNGIALSATRINALIDQEAARAGHSADWVKDMKADVMSKVHAGVINNHLADDNDREALKYYQTLKTKHPEQLTGQVETAVKKALDEGSTRGNAYRAYDAAKAKYPDNFAKQMKAVEKLPPKEREYATRLVKEGQAVKDNIEREQSDHAVTALLQHIQDGGGTRTIPPHVAVHLGPAGQQIADRLIEERDKGIIRETDPKAFAEFRDIVYDKTKMAGMPLVDFYGKYFLKFSPEDREYAASMREAAIKAVKNEKVGDKHASTLQFDDLVDSMAVEYGVFPKGKSKKDLTPEQQRDYRNFRVVADRAVKSFEAGLPKGRVANSVEMEQAITQAFAKKVFLNEWGRDPEKPIAALKPEERRNAYVPYEKIPPQFITNVTNKARSDGLKILGRSGRIDKSVMERAYAAALMGDDAMLTEILNGK